VRNPAIPSTMAILSALVVGLTCYFIFRKPAETHPPQAENSYSN